MEPVADFVAFRAVSHFLECHASINNVTVLGTHREIVCVVYNASRPLLPRGEALPSHVLRARLHRLSGRNSTQRALSYDSLLTRLIGIVLSTSLVIRSNLFYLAISLLTGLANYSDTIKPDLLVVTFTFHDE